jgi:hypothetical protein
MAREGNMADTCPTPMVRETHRKTSFNWSMCDREELKWDFEALTNGGHIDQIAFYLLSFSIIRLTLKAPGPRSFVLR